MAVQQSLIRTSTGILKIQKSVVSLNKSFSATQKTAIKINSTLIRSNQSKQSFLRLDKANFAKRREAVRRRESEDIIEASNVGGAIKRQGKIATNSTKGLFGRILDSIGILMVGWLIQNLPRIISLAEQLITRIRSLVGILGNWVQSLGTTLSGFGSLLGSIFSNVVKFDFTDQSGQISQSIKQIETGIGGMETGFNDAIELLKQPFDFSIPEAKEDQAAPQPPSESGAYQPQTTYYSEGGEKIVDVGGKDYGYYRPGAAGSRGKARVHGADARTRGHTGEDYAMPIGTPLTMIAKGTVVDVENNVARGGGYGKFVVIQLDSGEFVKLAHLDSINVKKGDRVGAGTGPNGTARVVGFSGNTGLSSGPHLHLDYSKSYDPATAAASGTMDPMAFINGGGLVKGRNVKSTGETRVSTPPPPTPGSTTQPAPKGGTLSTAQLVSLARQVGMTKQVNVAGYKGPLDVLMGAVAMAESSGRSSVFRNDTQVYGLWQIQFPTHRAALAKIGITSAEQLKDPLTNAKAAKMVYDRQGITAWEAFTKGKHKSFLPEAQKAASSTTQAKVSSPPKSNNTQQITPERRSQPIFVPIPGNQSSPAPQQSSGSSGSSSPTNSENPLNTLLQNLQLFSLTR